MSFFQKVWKEVAFFVGDVRGQSSFPYVTWSKHSHLVDYDEIMEVLPEIKYGDIGLHRDMHFLSNVFIPGFMKHSWIHTEDGITSPKIVEAISEGVVMRNPYYPLFSDFFIILSPKNVTDEEREGACLKANKIVGAEYGIDFNFDIEEELAFYAGDDKGAAAHDLQCTQENLCKYKFSFSCSEAVSYAWWHKREQLQLYRQVRKGYNCILPDDFLNHGWEIKWLSKSVTVKAARDIGLHEEGIQMIAEYIEQNDTAGHVSEKDITAHDDALAPCESS